MVYSKEQYEEHEGVYRNTHYTGATVLAEYRENLVYQLIYLGEREDEEEHGGDGDDRHSLLVFEIFRIVAHFYYTNIYFQNLKSLRVTNFPKFKIHYQTYENQNNTENS